MLIFDSPRLWTVKHGRTSWQTLAHHRGEALAWYLRLHGCPPAAELASITIRLA